MAQVTLPGHVCIVKQLNQASEYMLFHTFFIVFPDRCVIKAQSEMFLG